MTPSTPVDTEMEHSDAHRMLAAYAAGLLSDADERLLLSHASDCDECRVAVAELRSTESQDPAPGGHIAPRLLATWPRAQTTLKGLERRLVREHLESCDLCRDELRVLGFSPEMSAAEAGSRVLRLQQPRVDWVRWAFGSWAAVATAAAALLIIVRPVAPPQIVEHVVTVESPQRVELLASDPLAGMPTFTETMRGEAAALPPPTLSIASSQHTLYLPVPPLPVAEPTAAAVGIEVLSRSDSVLCRLDTTLGELVRARAVPWSAGSAGFSSGEYRLRIRCVALEPIAKDGIEDFPFRLEVTP